MTFPQVAATTVAPRLFSMHKVATQPLVLHGLSNFTASYRFNRKTPNSNVRIAMGVPAFRYSVNDR